MDIKFESLIVDEHFVTNVQKGGAEARKYIDSLLEEYPNQKEEILYAVQFLNTVAADSARLRGIESAEIWENIQQKQNIRKRFISERKRNVFIILSRIAAVAIIIFGFSFYFYHQYSANSFKRIAQNAEVPAEEAMIILSDGSEHKLQNNESSISYNEGGEEIIITESDEKSEKINNTKSTGDGVLNQIVVPFGRRHKVILSDGTVVQLNSGSKLVFPANFTGSTRKVYLLGEGFFEVAKNNEKPFIVNTDFIDIKVTGTVFNVTAYADEPEISAVLVEGSVEVSQKNKIFGNTGFDLSPGQGCFYSVNTEQAKVSEVDVANYIGWKDGWFQFKDQPLLNIVRRIGKYYNRNIQIEGEELAKTLISGKLVLSDRFEDTLDNLIKTLDGTFEINNQETYIIKE